ncbi:MAG: thiamine phosphate synthase [Elusimicrobia bacterium]|nr:thiamine phosphate synthase [Elusimicrobiota bacterium]
MKIIGITNRLLCKNDFFEQIKLICKENLYALILREKDLDDKTYEEFAVKCNDICKENNVLFFINTKINIAQKLNIKNIQVSFEDFVTKKEVLNSFDIVAVSIHSLSEALTIQKFVEETNQNIFLIAGHIFETDCKKGLAPRGIEFLKEICANVEIPVFAIGGINKDTIKQLKGINIEGVCSMSELMIKSAISN